MTKASPFIPKRFETRLLLHAYTGSHPAGHCPLILGIQGPSGFGKSFQARAVARARGFIFSGVSASSLAGTLESEPVEQLEASYVRLSMQLQRQNSAGFMLLDDFDMGIAGIHSDTTYTVNSQLLTGFLMALCDDPLLNGRLTRPVPVVITGNNLGVLHAPLTRLGRMEVFEWVPTDSERIEIISNIFGPTLSKSDVQCIVQEFKDRPISFFRQLTVETWRKRAEVIMSRMPQNPRYSTFHARLNIELEYTRDDLIRLGHELEQNSQLRNYVADPSKSED